MKAICLNDHVGYDQGGRTSLYRELKAVGWDVSKLKTDCECDCSSLIAVVLNAVGISLSKDIYTGNACCIVRCGFCQVPRSPVRSFLPGLGRSAGICPLGVGISLLKQVSAGSGGGIAGPVLILLGITAVCGAAAIVSFRWG